MVTWEEIELLRHGTHKDFEEIMKGEGDIPECKIRKLREGDLILRNKKAGCSLFYHAGVYLNRDEEVIEFYAASEQNSAGFSSCSSSSDVDGGVGKVGLNTFISNLPYVVLRLKNPIPKDFADRVKKAMKSKKKYNVLTYNCMHFALELLGLST